MIFPPPSTSSTLQEHSTGLEDRQGTEEEVARLHDTFEGLGFNVHEPYTDLRQQEIFNVLNEGKT